MSSKGLVSRRTNSITEKSQLTRVVVEEKRGQIRSENENIRRKCDTESGKQVYKETSREEELDRSNETLLEYSLVSSLSLTRQNNG